MRNLIDNLEQKRYFAYYINPKTNQPVFLNACIPVGLFLEIKDKIGGDQ